MPTRVHRLCHDLYSKHLQCFPSSVIANVKKWTISVQAPGHKIHHTMFSSVQVPLHYNRSFSLSLALWTPFAACQSWSCTFTVQVFKLSFSLWTTRFAVYTCVVWKCLSSLIKYSPCYCRLSPRNLQVSSLDENSMARCRTLIHSEGGCCIRKSEAKRTRQHCKPLGSQRRPSRMSSNQYFHQFQQVHTRQAVRNDDPSRETVSLEPQHNGELLVHFPPPLTTVPSLRIPPSSELIGLPDLKAKKQNFWPHQQQIPYFLHPLTPHHDQL